MPNSSDTFKTGELVLEAGGFECLICRSMGKRTTVTLEKGAIVPFCPGCETKDATYAFVGAPKGSRRK
ncbi:MAG TPA: hypothetical protein VE404_05840 [Verrucomicrobiae bacterium]|nr:hypothetical protein [Verrucomicrobiae bacterium]